MSRLAQLRLPLLLLLLLLPALALLAACSAPRLSYERLDWIAGWQLGRYVDLDHEQQRRFDAWFDSVWDWHRAEQLPVYAQDLERLSAQLDGPITAADLLDWQRRAEAHWDRLVRRALPPACPLLHSLRPAQRDSILERIDARIGQDRDKYLEGSAEEVRARAGKRLLRNLQRWVGRLEDAQREQVLAWSHTRQRSYEDWIQRREQWRQRLALQLQAPAQPRACEDLVSLFLRGPAEGALHRPVEAGDADGRQFLAALLATLDAQQRRHLRDRLRDWQLDFEVLAARAGS